MVTAEWVGVWSLQVCGDPGVVPPGRYRRGSVSHSWSETTVSQNSTAAGAVSSPERLYTPVDELLSSATTAERQQLHGAPAAAAAAAASALPLTDDGPYSRTSVFTAEYSDTREH